MDALGAFLFTAVCTGVRHAYWVVIGNWLWNLYRHGPHITSYGFWAGMADEDVCSRLSSGSLSSDWLTPHGVASSRCLSMIERSFRSFTVLVHTCLYVWFLLLCMRACTSYWHRRRVSKTLIEDFYAHGLVLARAPQQYTK